MQSGHQTLSRNQYAPILRENKLTVLIKPRQMWVVHRRTHWRLDPTSSLVENREMSSAVPRTRDTPHLDRFGDGRVLASFAIAKEMAKTLDRARYVH
jgi:hypothetical protein